MPALDLIAALLVVSGIGKLREPDSARAALRSARLPSWSVLVRAVGLAEVMVGAVCVVRPLWTVDLTVALLYLAFAAALARLLRSGADLDSCGCLGATDAPPSWIHVTFNLAAVAIACVAALLGSASLPQLVVTHPPAGLVVLVGIAASIRLAVVVFTVLPGALTAYRRPSS